MLEVNHNLAWQDQLEALYKKHGNNALYELMEKANQNVYAKYEPINYAEVLNFFFSKGFNINYNNGYFFSTSLMDAINFKNLKMVDAILECEDLDLNIQDSEGKTALHHAVESNQAVIAVRLLCKGANPDIQDKDGNIALNYAPNSKNLCCILHYISKEPKEALDNRARLYAKQVLKCTQSAQIEKLLASTAEYHEMEFSQNTTPTLVTDNAGEIIDNTLATDNQSRSKIAIKCCNIL